MSSRIKTQIPGPKSQELQRQKEQHVSNSVAPAMQVFVDHAEGSVITDVDGNELLDFSSGIGVISFGHGTGNEKMKAQIDKFAHTLFTIAPYELYVKVAEQLNELAPGDFAKKSALSSTGAEAIENAVKVARAYTRRNGIAVVEHGYHGRTNLTLGMNYKATPYAANAGPRPGEIYRVANSYKYRDGRDGVTAAKDAIKHLEKISGAENLACVVIEPIQGEGGVMIPEDGYLTTLQEWAHEHGILMVADEIQTGLGRTGKVFASEHFGFEPDIIVTAKAIGAGIPLSAITGRAEVMDTMPPGALSGTFSGNPVACAAALDVFELLRDEATLAHCTEVGERIQAGLAELKEKYSVIGDVRGLGALHGIEFITEDGQPNAAAYKAVQAGCLERGLIALPGGSDGHVLRLLPAANVSFEIVDEALAILGEAIGAYAAK